MQVFERTDGGIPVVHVCHHNLCDIQFAKIFIQIWHLSQFSIFKKPTSIITASIIGGQNCCCYGFTKCLGRETRKRFIVLSNTFVLKISSVLSIYSGVDAAMLKSFSSGFR